MGLYRKKPVVIEAYTWDEMLELGRKICIAEGRASNIVNGMPWSFHINGRAVTHENDRCYTICTLEGNHHMTPDDMLIIGIKGEAYPCKLDIFQASYEAAQ